MSDQDPKLNLGKIGFNEASRKLRRGREMAAKVKALEQAPAKPEILAKLKKLGVSIPPNGFTEAEARDRLAIASSREVKAPSQAPKTVPVKNRQADLERLDRMEELLRKIQDRDRGMSR